LSESLGVAALPVSPTVSRRVFRTIGYTTCLRSIAESAANARRGEVESALTAREYRTRRPPNSGTLLITPTSQLAGIRATWRRSAVSNASRVWTESDSPANAVPFAVKSVRNAKAGCSGAAQRQDPTLCATL